MRSSMEARSLSGFFHIDENSFTEMHFTHETKQSSKFRQSSFEK